MWWALVIIPLFILVIRNNKNNEKRLYNRKGRNFRKNYYQRKKETSDE